MQAILAAIEVGEPGSFAALAEWLEARGDSRARLVRAAMETVPAEIAQLVYEDRFFHAHVELLRPRDDPFG